MKTQGILPPRPLKLQRGHLKGVWALGILLIVLGVAVFGVAALCGMDYFRIRHEQALFAEGDEALHVSVMGYSADVTSLFLSRRRVPSHHSGGFSLWRSYVLTVEYIDAQEAVHTKDLEFLSLFDSVDERSPILVRYDPINPDDFAFSWAVAMTPNRLWGKSLQTVLFGLLAAAGILGGCAIIHYGYDLARAAEDGQEVALQIVSAEELRDNDQSTGHVRYRYRLATEPNGKIREEIYPKKNGPLFLDASGRVMLGLRSPRNGGRIIVIKHDLGPFEFTTAEKEGIRQRIAARRAMSDERSE